MYVGHKIVQSFDSASSARVYLQLVGVGTGGRPTDAHKEVSTGGLLIITFVSFYEPFSPGEQTSYRERERERGCACACVCEKYHGARNSSEEKASPFLVIIASQEEFGESSEDARF